MDYLTIAKDALIAQSDAIRTLSGRIGSDFQEAVKMILNCPGRIVICGMGKSGLIGKKISATLASTGTPSFYLHPGEAFHGDLGMLRPVDVVMMISYSGETDETIKLLPSLKAFGNPVIAMTGKPESTIAVNADIHLDISVEREVCPNNLAPTTSTLASMAMGDALAVALIKARNFNPEDFAKYHPGGNLGRRLLTRVRDVMHKKLPIISPDTSFHECLMAMTSGRLGLALVMNNNKLAGIVTDGDLRRALIEDPAIAGKTASDFMTATPRTVTSDTRITDAEQTMRSNKLKALVVVDENHDNIVGVVEIFD